LYRVATGKTTLSSSDFIAADSEGNEGRSIVLGPDECLGVLVVNTSQTKNGGAVVSVARTLAVWVRKVVNPVSNGRPVNSTTSGVTIVSTDGPSFNPDNKPLKRTLREVKNDAGVTKETNEVILTDASHIAYRNDYVDPTPREYHYRWDFTIKFQETATGLAPRVLQPGELYQLEVTGDWTEKTRTPEKLLLGGCCWLGVRRAGLEFPHANRSLKDRYPEGQFWPDGLLLLGDIYGNERTESHLKSTCAFRLENDPKTGAPPDVVTLDFLLGLGGNAPALRYEYERREVTPKQLEKLLDEDK
jgi:hypothetical protein